MKALSVMEPWASLIIYGPKDSENRTWATNYRGPLVICASAKLEPGWQPSSWNAMLADMLEEDIQIPERLNCDLRKAVNPGHALGIVDVIGCDREMRSYWDERDQYHFRLANKRAFRNPFKVKGQLGFYEISDRLVEIAS